MITRPQFGVVAPAVLFKLPVKHYVEITSGFRRTFWYNVTRDVYDYGTLVGNLYSM